MANIIGVNFKNDKTSEFGGRTYNYFCDAAVKIGDVVVAPTSRGETIARVCEVDVPASRIDERVEATMKTVSALAEKEDSDVN